MGSFAPDWMTEEAIDTVKGGYLQDGETVWTAFSRVAKSAKRFLIKEGLDVNTSNSFESDLFDVLSKGYLGLATPVFCNLGTNNGGLPISCFATHVEDSVVGIFDTLKETALLTKAGGGVAVYAGDIRPTGSKIESTNGKSCGSVPFLKLFDETAFTVSQGNTRRGSFALYLPIDHPDIGQLLLSKDHTQGDSRRWIDSNVAVTITDDWMRSMIAGDESKRKLFCDVIRTRLMVGSPYLIFVDNINKANPPAYQKHNLTVKTSNLCCLDGHTEVMTNSGPRRIIDILGDTVTIHDGEQWVENSSFQLRGYDNIWEIKFTNGHSVKCNALHRWFVAGSGKEILTTDLTPGTALESCSYLYDGPDFIVKSIKKTNKIKPVYCPSVPSTGKFALASGLMTGNSEITLYTDSEHTFTCCLSSLNLDKFDEWAEYTTPKLGWSVPFISTVFLDAVLSEFIYRAKEMPGMEKAVRSSLKGRALGLGVMGLASLYQKRGFPFESSAARVLNVNIHKYIYSEAVEASKFLAEQLGEPFWCVGTGMRNTHLIALAPTRTNSAITNSVSPSVEPIDSNYYIAKQAKGSYIRKNPNLEQYLISIRKNTKEVWDKILENEGSVQTLDFMPQEHKEVFRTAREIDQREILRQAAARQPYVCQSQSINLFINPFANEQFLVELHIQAWSLGMKSLYYLRSRNKNKLKNVNILITKPECPWCEKLKNELDSRKTKYTEMVLSEAKRLGIWKQSYKTVPQLFFNDEHVGGYEDFMEKYVYGTWGPAIPNHVDGECISCEG
jgi:ribonucleotide reductase alpha subunit